MHLGHCAERIAAGGDAIEALPAGQGDDQRQQQHHAEADAEFERDTNVTQVLG